MPKRQRTQTRYIPLWGTVVAGPLEGWAYSFLQFVWEPGEKAPSLDLRCTPPNWPFPMDVRFSMAHDRFQLQGAPRCRRLDADELMKTALEHGFARALSTTGRR